MSKRRQKNISSKWVTGSVVAAAVLLMGSSFAVASGAADGSGSMLAAALTSFSSSGKTVITVSAQPGGVNKRIYPNKEEQYIGAFSTTVTGVKSWATLNQIVVEIPITGVGASDLLLSDIKADFKSCIPAGKTYGYGFKSRGECASYKFTTSSVVRNGNTYNVVFLNHAPLYPEQDVGGITVTATASYSSTVRSFATLSTKITQAYARGEVCKKVAYGYKNKYSYTKCEGGPAQVNLGAARGPSIIVDLPYGYPKSGKPSPRTSWFW